MNIDCAKPLFFDTIVFSQQKDDKLAMPNIGTLPKRQPTSPVHQSGVRPVSSYITSAPMERDG